MVATVMSLHQLMVYHVAVVYVSPNGSHQGHQHDRHQCDQVYNPHLVESVTDVVDDVVDVVPFGLDVRLSRVSEFAPPVEGRIQIFQDILLKASTLQYIRSVQLCSMVQWGAVGCSAAQCSVVQCRLRQYYIAITLLH